jgi:hypothetical protein
MTKPVLGTRLAWTTSSPGSIRLAWPRQTVDQAHLCTGKCLAERCVGMSEFGDLVLQSVDFREEHGDMFGLDCLCRANPLTGSPVAETAPIRAEALVGSGRGIDVATVLTNVSTRAQIAPERRRKAIHICSTCVAATGLNTRCRMLKRLECQMCDGDHGLVWA